MKKLTSGFVILCLCATQAHGQVATDTAKMNGYLSEITVIGAGSKRDIQQMPEVVGTAIYAGKKSSLVVLDNVQGNIVTNNMRQVLAKVPGIHIWESDASNIQIGVSARGLSPNRSWEFNVRQNGYDISADPYGYPEAYYNPQLQAVQRIQVVRGAGALQYGPQFGGMINYILRDGSDVRKPFQFETHQTVGSYGLFNTFNAIGGNTDKVHYYAFFDHRNGNGWRENSAYRTNTGFATVNFKVNNRLKIGAEVMIYDMLSQQPGGLNDSMFAQNAQKSYRSRNWFSTPWTTAALNAEYKINASSKLTVMASGMMGNRSSVGYMGRINNPDTINPQTLQHNPREVAKDEYRNYSLEARCITDYAMLGMKNTLSVGVRGFMGNTGRWQRGIGTTGSDYDMSITNDKFPTQLEFNTSSYAVFAENIFRLSDKLYLIPGIRYENISTTVNGRTGFASNGVEIRILDETRNRSMLLAGVGAEYHLGNTEIYGNMTQNYRPMLFSDLSAAPTTDIIDPNMKDASGYNIDLGYRGTVADYLFFDVSGFYLKYTNRLGTLAQFGSDGSTVYNFKTNVGNSTSTGVEALIQFDPVRAFYKNSKFGGINMFASYGYTNAVYDDFTVRTYNNATGTMVESNLKGNKVENAPEHILRTGITYSLKGISLTYQYSYVSEAFSNSSNTRKPTVDGTAGLIPAYGVSDLTLSYQFTRNVNLKAGVNNLTDERYFTRRAGGYPGPGLLPADGRTFFLTVGAKI